MLLIVRGRTPKVCVRQSQSAPSQKGKGWSLFVLNGAKRGFPVSNGKGMEQETPQQIAGDLLDARTFLLVQGQTISQSNGLSK
jgi:hypothetical protein